MASMSSAIATTDGRDIDRILAHYAAARRLDDKSIIKDIVGMAVVALVGYQISMLSKLSLFAVRHSPFNDFR